MKISREEARAMALELAARGPLGNPNPRVGCVITSEDGDLLATGYHQGAGTPHAEAAAIRQARENHLDLAGATAYVSLEPCAHVGRTPSCAHGLLEAGVGRVIFGQADSNGQASGGAEILRRAGVTARQDFQFAADGEALNREWTFSIRHGRPWVTWKYAATLDGLSAASDGTSKWITGEAARQDVQTFRKNCGAILVGTGTALADNPRLTVRDEHGNDLQQGPLRAVMGMRDLPSDLHLCQGETPAIHLRTREPAEALRDLHSREVRSVWLEGGPKLAASFMKAGLVDEVIAYFAPRFLGSGHQALGDLQIDTLAASDLWDVEDAVSISSPDQTDIRVRLTRRTSQNGN